LKISLQFTSLDYNPQNVMKDHYFLLLGINAAAYSSWRFRHTLPL
jgi:hypothetical protein